MQLKCFPSVPLHELCDYSWWKLLSLCLFVFALLCVDTLTTIKMFAWSYTWCYICFMSLVQSSPSVPQTTLLSLIATENIYIHTCWDSIHMMEIVKVVLGCLNIHGNINYKTLSKMKTRGYINLANTGSWYAFNKTVYSILFHMCFYMFIS